MMMINKDDQHINLRRSYYGPWERHIVRNKPYRESISTLIFQNSESPPGLQPAKKRDLLNLIQYLEDPEHRRYYEALLEELESHTEHEPTEEIVDIDNDDNSDVCEEN